MTTAIPETFAQTMIALYGDTGAAWLQRLPALIADCAQRWSLTVQPPFPDLSYNYAAPAVTAHGEAVVLKIGVVNPELLTEMAALRLYEEEGLLNPLREGTRRIYRERDRVRLRLILRGKRLGWSLAEIRESFDLYESDHGEEAQLELMLNKLAERRESLQRQKRDIEHALEDLGRIVDDAETALAEIRSGAKRRRHG